MKWGVFVRFAAVIVSVSHRDLDHVFHYIIPEKLESVLKVGMRVCVPFGNSNRKIKGYVIEITDTIDFDIKKAKYIDCLIEDYAVLSSRRIELAKWMADKYYSNLIDCFQCIVPKNVKDKTFDCVYIDYQGNTKEDIDKLIKKNNKQSAVLNYIYNGDCVPVSHIREYLGIDTAPINALKKKGILKVTTEQIYRGKFNTANIKRTTSPILNTEQEMAVNKIVEGIDNPDKMPILLKGVTGSGKTEVYLNAIAYALKQGKSAIVLVPEISLTPQTVERFVQRFGDKVAVTHSKMSDGERFDQWHRAINGEISIMIGPRSAIFTPFENLGIIIIDEEHESTYKSDQLMPKFDAREIAMWLKNAYNTMVVLGSATPSVESYYMAQQGVYELVEIKNRVNMQPPEISIVDMRNELEKGNKSLFSIPLYEALEKNLESKKQTILFLNRRGHSTFVSCRKCGYVMTCENCNVNYTYHKGTGRLICHYCGKEINNPVTCPVCNSKYIKYFGVGTEKIEQEVNRLFPQARTLRMDLDTTTGKNSHTKILNMFKNHEADILIGTQMIAKGLDFPDVTLVGVLAADLSLNLNDFHSAEKTYQLITQVSGRAGRAKDKGQVFVQTYNPQHYSIVAAANNDYEGFYNEEIAFRKSLGYPPFTNLFFVMLTGAEQEELVRQIRTLYEIMVTYDRNNQFQLIGPAPAVISKINNKYRWRMIVKGDNEEKLKIYVQYCINKLRQYSDLKNINVSLVLNPSYSF